MPLSMYEWLKGHDVMEWLKPLWDGGGWVMNKDGKLEQNRSQIAIDSPWVHHGQTGWAKCLLWSRVMFQVASMNMKNHFADGVPFVPSGCQNCYKVVVRPKTLEQLFALNELETELGLPSKCGIEVRDEVHGLYGGYFYNQGLDAGQECYEKVRAAIDKDAYLGPKVKVILKRACTEMEHAVGPSDQWTVTEEQKVVEDLINEWITIADDQMEAPEAVVWRVKRKWIDFAYANGDETYLKFTGGKPITPSYVTYHEKKVQPTSLDVQDMQISMRST